MCFYLYSGSTDALWFSSKYEKKMAALDENIPGSPKFQSTVPLKQSKLITGKQNVKTLCISRDDERLKRALKLLFFFSEIFPKIYQD